MSAKLGTPENPEIIDPREPRQPPPPPPSDRSGRWAFLLRLLWTMLSVTIPAAGIDLICLRLVQAGLQPDGFWAWLPLIFLVPIALVLTFVAVLINLFLLVAVVLALSGRSVGFPAQSGQILRFVRMRRF